MAVLSNTEIRVAVASGRLIVKPEPVVSPGLPETLYDEASLTVHLGDVVHVPKGDTQVAFALFSVTNGTGLRGFSRAGKDLLTWEVALQEQQKTVSAGNVVSLSARKGNRRRPRR